MRHNGWQVGDVADLRSEKIVCRNRNKDMKTETRYKYANGNKTNLLLANVFVCRGSPSRKE